MVQTETDIVNQALIHAGQTKLLAAFRTDKGEAASIAQAVFDTLLAEVLEARPWPFATRRQLLALLAVTRTDWRYVYAVPADLLVARYLVLVGTRFVPPSEGSVWTVESNDAGDGQVILTDQANAELVYTFRHAVPSAWPAGFVVALSHRLAVPLAAGLIKGSDGARVAQLNWNAYQLALRKAFAVRANEQQRDDPALPAWIRKR